MAATDDDAAVAAGVQLLLPTDTAAVQHAHRVPAPALHSCRSKNVAAATCRACADTTQAAAAQQN